MCVCLELLGPEEVTLSVGIIHSLACFCVVLLATVLSFELQLQMHQIIDHCSVLRIVAVFVLYRIQHFFIGCNGSL